MQRRQQRHTALGHHQRNLNGLKFMHFNNLDHVRVLSHGSSQTSVKSFSVLANFALSNDRLFVFVEIQHRIFDRDDMLISTFVDGSRSSVSHGQLADCGACSIFFMSPKNRVRPRTVNVQWAPVLTDRQNLQLRLISIQSIRP